MKNIAIIPARSGSKGLKNKNIRLLNGKPLIAYTIEAAIKSEQFETVIVSTDSEEYGEIAKKHGAIVPFLRSKELSSDVASSWDVVRDILYYYQKKNVYFDTVSLLQPTSPFRDYEDISKGYEDYQRNNATSVVSVCEEEESPLWTNTLPDNNSLENFISEGVLSIPRQQLPKYYRLNGAMYIVKSSQILQSKNIYDEGSYAFIMSRKKSIDIDDIMDFKFAEFMLNNSTSEEE